MQKPKSFHFWSTQDSTPFLVILEAKVWGLNLEQSWVMRSIFKPKTDEALDVGGHFSHSGNYAKAGFLNYQVACGTEIRHDNYKSEL